MLSSLHSADYQLGLFPSTRIDYVTMNELFKPFKDAHVPGRTALALVTTVVIGAASFCCMG